MPDHGIGRQRILCADIGGTNSRFGLFTTGVKDDLVRVGSKWFRTADAGSFADLVDMLSGSEFPLRPEEADIAVIAIAGPVEDGVRCSPPLIAWDIDITHPEIARRFKRVILVNDFVAQAYSFLTDAGRKAQEIVPGQKAPGAAVAVVGAGTGFGKAVLVPDGLGGYGAMASEGGHVNFPFVSEEEMRFQEFLVRELGGRYITYNNVVSGAGLSLIHRFLTGDSLDPEDVLSACGDSCRTVEWAARFYGRACRNFVLETVARGGLYIAGGLAARAPVLVTNRSFAEEFRDSKTMASILSRVPVFLITDEESGLWGAAALGRQVLGKREPHVSGGGSLGRA